jgi:hypothetical protein
MLVDDRGEVVRTQTSISSDSTTLAVVYSSGLQVLVSSMGSSVSPLTLRIIGDKGWKDLFFQNTYSAFKTALYEFTQGIIHKDERTKAEFILEVIALIEAGRKGQF